jgi:xanthine dehydrogenase molybdopterin-binding subunit B
MWMPYGRRPDRIIEGEYTTGAQEHLYIENNGAIACIRPMTG